ncbi:MAG: crossover junction endodeoxyribonuclease RuvC, partial [Clostridia bacterium]|nr:crossover junction endodeoxyribonuclease RuvC [Clostridia bacterium]
MKVLGIDPGLATMGWGVVEARGSQVTLLEAGALIP